MFFIIYFQRSFWVIVL